jgi:D-alanyl-D-alanine carboxypeptidase
VSLRAPVAATLLSLLAFVAPSLTLAPLQAVEPGLRTTPVDVPLERVVPRVAPSGARALEQEAVDREFRLALDAARAAGSAYGVTFAVVDDGLVIWTGSAGRARDGATPLTSDARFVIGSVTKTYVAAAVLQLVSEGRLSLNDVAADRLPGIALSREITIRQLLDHSSGLADLFNDATRRGLEERPGVAWTQDQILASLHEPWYPPGEGWAYANTNYYLLGRIVESVTGSSLADELDRRFLGPIALNATTVLTGATGEPLSPAWASIFWASGAMSSSAADLARWGDALYDGGVLPAALRAQMLDWNDDDYGLGAQRIEVPGAVGYGHTGLLDTYTTLLLYLPSADVTLTLLVNRTNVDLGAMLTAHPAGGGPSLLDLALGRD